MPDFEYFGVTLFFSMLGAACLLVLYDIYHNRTTRNHFTVGGEPERFAVITILYMAFVQAAAYVPSVANPTFTEVDSVSLLSDTIGLVGFVGIALRARRYWPLIPAGLQVVTLFFHYGRNALPDLLPIAYSGQKSTPTAVALFVVVLALLYRQWHIRSKGWDVDWMAPKYYSVYSRASDRAFLWDFLSTFGRSNFGWVVRIWGMLVVGYSIVLLFSIGGATMDDTSTYVMLVIILLLSGVLTAIAGHWFDKREIADAKRKSREFKMRWPGFDLD